MPIAHILYHQYHPRLYEYSRDVGKNQSGSQICDPRSRIWIDCVLNKQHLCNRSTILNNFTTRQGGEAHNLTLVYGVVPNLILLNVLFFLLNVLPLLLSCRS
jgi:hypothetical protein